MKIQNTILLSLVIISSLSNNVYARRRNLRASAIRKTNINTSTETIPTNTVANNSSSSTETNTNNWNHLVENMAAQYPANGTYFKNTHFVFREGQNYKLSDIIKGDDKNADALITSCGVTLEVFDSEGRLKIGDGNLETKYPDSSSNKALAGAERFEEFSFSIKQQDLENSYISFAKGSAQACDNYRVFLLDGAYNSGRDKMLYTIQVAENDKEDEEAFANIVEVSKDSYENVKNDCANLDVKALNEVKNLLTASSITSGIGAVSGLAGTGIGVANIVNNNKNGNENKDLGKKLDIASTITSGISAASSTASTTTSVIAIKKVEELIKKIEVCKNSAKSL